MRAIVAVALFLASSFSTISASAQEFRELRQERLENDVKHYHGLVVTYCAGNDDVVAELLAYDEKRLSEMAGAINTVRDANRPWGDDALRCGALLQTAVGLAALNERGISGMKFYFNLAAQHLRMGSAALEPFAGRWYFAAARIYRSHNVIFGVFDAETLLERARRHLPSNPLVLYESAFLEELLAIDWRTALMTPADVHAAFRGGPFRELDSLDEVLKYRATRLQNARDWLRQSVATAPTALSRLHLGRVLMMRREDDEALLQLDAVRKDTTDRATQYLAILFTAALHERSGRLDVAARTYQQAIECFPESDAAYLGLSEVLQSAGRGDQARTVLRDLLKPRPQRHEPWTWYFLEPQSVARERLAALFEEGRR
jgi:tetratricopeptide (TPR) repeat protein